MPICLWQPKLTPILEIPLPVVLQEPQFGVLSENVLLSMAMAAQTVGTLMFIRPESYTPAFEKYAANLVPCLTPDKLSEYTELDKEEPDG